MFGGHWATLGSDCGRDPVTCRRNVTADVNRAGAIIHRFAIVPDSDRSQPDSTPKEGNDALGHHRESNVPVG